MRVAPVLAASGALIGAIGLLVLSLHAGNSSEENARIVEYRLAQWSQAQSEVQQNLLQLRFGKHQNYDRLNAVLADFVDCTENLSVGLAAQGADLMESCRHSLLQINGHISHVQENVDKFVTENATLDTSLRVLTRFASDPDFLESGGDPISRVLISVLAFAIHEDSGYREQSERLIHRFTTEAKRESSRHGIAIRHATVALEESATVTQSLDMLLGGDADESLATIRSLVSEHASKRAHAARNRALVLICLVLIVAGVLMSSLHSLARSSAALRRAELATESKSLFLANMSHEIRTPMNGIVTMVRMLKESELDKDQAEYARIIQVSSDALVRVINDILDFSKLEAGKVDLEEIPLCPRTLISDLVSLMETKAEETEVTLQAEIASNVPEWVLGDPGRIRQVLMNLISNAIKFAPNGVVTMRLGLGEDSRSGEMNLVAQVQDSGIGISKEDCERLFGAFQQADASTTRRFGGTGLGLSIVRDLLKLMHGQIEVTSTLGRGSLFTATFPVGATTQVHLPSPETPSAGTRKNYSGRKVLVVEDNAINQKIARMILERLDVRVCMASNGLEGIDAVQRESPDLVLMDCQMPVLDGFQATAKIRVLDQPYREIPIVALTANASESDREQCIVAGMDDFLSKPIQKAEMDAVLERFLPAIET